MPRTKKKKEGEAPQRSEVPLRTIRCDKKTYEAGGGYNRHGRFVVLGERVGKRNNLIYFDVKNLDQVLDMVRLAAEDVKKIPSRVEVPEFPPQI